MLLERNMAVNKFHPYRVLYAQYMPRLHRDYIDRRDKPCITLLRARSRFPRYQLAHIEGCKKTEAVSGFLKRGLFPGLPCTDKQTDFSTKTSCIQKKKLKNRANTGKKVNKMKMIHTRL